MQSYQLNRKAGKEDNPWNSNKNEIIDSNHRIANSVISFLILFRGVISYQLSCSIVCILSFPLYFKVCFYGMLVLTTCPRTFFLSIWIILLLSTLSWHTPSLSLYFHTLNIVLYQHLDSYNAFCFLVRLLF